VSECVNLRERFGRRFKVVYEEAHRAEYGPNARTEDPWLMILLCEHGHVFPHGDDQLAAFTDGPVIAKKLARLVCCEVWQEGDQELTVLFDVADFDAVAQILKPRRRRRLTPAQRQAASERLKQFRFSASHARAIPGAVGALLGEE